jgi:uncharacterized protein (TIGR00251 family)
MIHLTDNPEGIILPVRVRPGAKQAGIQGEHAGALKVSVTQPAEKGKANDALLETIADDLGLRRSQVELLSGQSQRDKRLLIRGISRNELAERIVAALAD